MKRPLRVVDNFFDKAREKKRIKFIKSNSSMCRAFSPRRGCKRKKKEDKDVRR